MSSFLTMSASIILTALAGSAVGQEPKVYFWSIPNGTNPVLTHPSMKPAVLYKIRGFRNQNGHPLPIQEAQLIKSEIGVYVSAGKVDPNDLCIILQDFGIDNRSPNLNTTSLLRAEDAVDVDLNGDGDPDWPVLPVDGFATNDYSQARRQPWMESGRSEVTTWMNSFLNEYNAAPAGPIPTRFHFDSEEYLIGTRRNYVFLAQQLPLGDNTVRWNNTIVPGSGQTMAQLWNQAKADFGGANPVAPWNGTLSSVVQYTVLVNQPRTFASLREPAESQFNRDIYLWYYDLTQRALDAAMKEVAYDPIKTRFPAVKVSDYADTYMRRGSFHAGWHQQPTPERECELPNLEWERMLPRGRHDDVQHGHRLETIPTTPAGQLKWRVLSDHRASGDFSAPHLYPVGERPTSGPDDCTWGNSWMNFRQRSPYLPLNPLEGNRWAVSLRHHRWWLESIMSSHEADGQIREPWLKIAPWIALPGSEPDGLKEKPGYPITVRDTIGQLALLRQKAIPEVIAWDNIKTTLGRTDQHLIDALSKFREQYERVYTPQLISAVRSGGVQQPFPLCDLVPLDRLRDTNRRANCDQTTPTYTFGDYAFPVVSSSTSVHTASVTATFNGFSASDFGTGNPDQVKTLRVYLEAWVDIPPVSFDETDRLRGTVSLWHWPSGQFIPFNIEDACPGGATPACDAGDDTTLLLADHVPNWFIPPAPNATTNRREIRRRFDIDRNLSDIPLGEFVNAQGRIRIRASFMCGLPFMAYFDLIQPHVVIASAIESAREVDDANTLPPGGRPAWTQPYLRWPANPAGGMMADLNATGDIEIGDLLDFADAFATGQTIADYNLDNAIDPADMDAFLNDYTGGN